MSRLRGCMLLVVAVALFNPAATEAWQTAREAKPPKKKSTTSAPNKGTARKGAANVAPKSDKDRDESAKSKTKGDGDRDQSEEHGKLADLKSDKPLPRLQELSIPTVEELHTLPVDWVVLKGPNKGNEQVVVVKPVFPRPDTLKKLQAALDELRRRPPPTSQQEKEKLAAQRSELQKLVVTLPGEGEGQLYEIPTNLIGHIVYHEDLIILRAGLMIDGESFRDAFELLYPLERQLPGWKGLKDQIERLVFREAEAALRNQDLESALVSLEELHGRNRDYSQLSDRLGNVVDKLISRCRGNHDPRQSRHFLGRLARIEPKHEVVEKWNRALLAEAQGLIEAALEAGRAGRSAEAVAMVDQAARIWPATPSLKDAHRKLTDRYQRLLAGVQSLARSASPSAVPTLADDREIRLTRFNVFEVDRIDDTTHYRSRLIEQWEPTDLGRRAVFTLKPTRGAWESRPILTSTALLSTLGSLIDPASPAFDERFASYVDALRYRSVFEFEVQFSHAPPRLECLFRFPVHGPSHRVSSAGAPDGAGMESAPAAIVSKRFEPARRSEREAVYRRAIPERSATGAEAGAGAGAGAGEGGGELHVAEIVERKYDSPELAVQGFLRGEISMLPDLPTWAVSVFRDDPRFFVINYAQPTTHVLQINPHSEVLRSRELRLALAYAINARRLLPQVVLRSSNSPSGRLTTAPFATTSYAYNSLVPLREYSTNIAASLYAAAVKRLKTVPHLRVACEPGAVPHAAMAQIVKEWKRIGIRADLLSRDEGGRGQAGWDIAYRTIRMEEPLVELWPFLTAGEGPRLESLRHFPDWLRVELLGLDQAGDWKSAVSRLQQLQAHLYEEVEYIPLWETDDAIVLRKNIRDFPPFRFVHAYQDVERWVVQSWYPEDEP